jgi:hypothetical protein
MKGSMGTMREQFSRPVDDIRKGNQIDQTQGTELPLIQLHAKRLLG